MNLKDNTTSKVNSPRVNPAARLIDTPFNSSLGGTINSGTTAKDSTLLGGSHRSHSYCTQVRGSRSPNLQVDWITRPSLAAL